MKKAKIILIISVLIFVTLIIVYIVGKNSNKETPVSKREQYQQELINAQETEGD